MKVHICCALDHEARPLIKALNLKLEPNSRTFRGFRGVYALKLIISGPGKENVINSFSEIFDSADVVISYGFAGALCPNLKRGDILLADEIVFPDGRIGNDFRILSEKMQSFLKGKSAYVHGGKLYSSSQMISSAKNKASLAIRFNAAAVDMESGTLYEEACRRKIRFFALRGITDGCNDDVPALMLSWTDFRGKMLWWKMIQDVLKSAGLISSMIRLGFASRKASRRLTRCLMMILNQRVM